MKLFALLALLFTFASPAKADFAGCRAISIGLFSSETYGSCRSCLRSNNYCQEICSKVQYTCTSLNSSSSVVSWLDGKATADNEATAKNEALMDCLNKAREAGATVSCYQATCTTSVADESAHGCR